MALVRTILAALIGISVALSPAIGQAFILPPPIEVTMSDQADMPCCPCCDTQDNFKATACAIKCITLPGAIFPATTVMLRYLNNWSPLSFTDDILHGLLRQPPTHPPPL